MTLIDELTPLHYETLKAWQTQDGRHHRIVRCEACGRKADTPESVVHQSDCPVYRLAATLASAAFIREAALRACNHFGVLAHDADRCYQKQRYADSLDDGIPSHWLLQMAASARTSADLLSAALADAGPGVAEVGE